MASMTRVPAAYLKQLAEVREIFNELPPAVKQQVGSHAVPIPYPNFLDLLYLVSYESAHSL
jgi:hypothetical protein